MSEKHTLETISEKILDIEKKVDVSRFTFKGEKVWPVIRVAIYLASSKAEPSSTSFSPLRSLIFMAGGALQLLGYGILRIFGTPHYDSVLVTTSHYKVVEQGKVYDKILSPVITFLKQRNISFNVWEFTGKFRYDQNISYEKSLRKIQKEVYFLSIMRRFLSRFGRKSSLNGDVDGLNRLLKENGLSFKLNAAFVNKLDGIFFQADFYQSKLRRHRTRHVFMVCYYDVKCFAVLLAANRLGISSIDMQHGLQGENHMAYAAWPKDLANQSRFLPTHFYVWDAQSFNTISHWKHDRQNILTGCNQWFVDRAQKESDELILVSLQPIDDFFPDFLLQIIKDYTGDKQWYIRLHPRQLSELPRLEKRLAEAGVSQSVELRKASSMPLSDILKRTALHITYYSSVAIEASYFLIPTFFLSAHHLSHYQNYLPDELIYHHPRHTIDEVIAGKNGQTASAKANVFSSVNVLEKFVSEV